MRPARLLRDHRRPPAAGGAPARLPTCMRVGWRAAIKQANQQHSARPAPPAGSASVRLPRGATRLSCCPLCAAGAPCVLHGHRGVDPVLVRHGHAAIHHPSVCQPQGCHRLRRGATRAVCCPTTPALPSLGSALPSWEAVQRCACTTSQFCLRHHPAAWRLRCASTTTQPCPPPPPLQGVNFSIQAGCNLSRAQVVTFKHNDVADLERVLKRIGDQHRRQRRAPAAAAAGPCSRAYAPIWHPAPGCAEPPRARRRTSGLPRRRSRVQEATQPPVHRRGGAVCQLRRHRTARPHLEAQGGAMYLILFPSLLRETV
jgi:hypothetical protein